MVLFRPDRRFPTDPELAQACASANKWNKRLLWISCAFWGIGFFSAYLLLPLTQYLES